MAPTSGTFLAVCLLLAGAGLMKLRRPAAADQALADLGIPGWNAVAVLPVGRVLGLVETVVAGAAMWSGGRWSAGLVALAYLAFAAVAWRLVATASGADCGCFGASRSPLTRAHVVVDLVFAATAAIGLGWSPTGLRQGWVTDRGDALLVGASGIVLAALGYLLFAALPPLLARRTAVQAR